MATVGRGDGGEKVKRGGGGMSAGGGRGSYTAGGMEGGRKDSLGWCSRIVRRRHLAITCGKRERRSWGRPDAHEAFYEWTEAIIEASD